MTVFETTIDEPDFADSVPYNTIYLKAYNIHTTGKRIGHSQHRLVVEGLADEHNAGRQRLAGAGGHADGRVAGAVERRRVGVYVERPVDGLNPREPRVVFVGGPGGRRHRQHVDVGLALFVAELVLEDTHRHVGGRYTPFQRDQTITLAPRRRCSALSSD